MIAPKGFNIYTQKFDDAVRGDIPPIDGIEALKASTAGVTINDVTGTAIPGTRTSAQVFTRASGVHMDRVILPLTAATGVFTVGETVTESSSSKTGVVEEATLTRVVLKTPSGAFTGGLTLTGGTSTYTATGGTAVNVVTNLAGKLLWSFATGTEGTGNWCRIKSNTATAITLIATDDLQATGTSIILSHEGFPATGMEEQFAREQTDISYGS